MTTLPVLSITSTLLMIVLLASIVIKSEAGFGYKRILPASNRWFVIPVEVKVS